MFTEKTLIMAPLSEALSALPKDELTGCPSNTCPINSVCQGLQTVTAAAAPAKESTSGCKSSEPDAAACGGGARILQSAEGLNAAAFILS